MSKNKISIDVHSTGDLLTETVRCFLHQGNPSALLSRVAKGIRSFENEGAVADDRELAGALAGILEGLARDMLARESDVEVATYPAPAFTRTYTPEDYDDEMSEDMPTHHIARHTTISPPAIDAVRCAAYEPSEFAPVKDN